MSRYVEYEPIMEELEKEVELADDWKTAHEIANVVKYAPSIEIALADDGTLLVDVKDATKVKRVLVEDGESGDLYYADRPQGEWIYHKELMLDKEYYPSRFECDQCHHYVIAGNDRNFCPHCGSKMRGEHDD